MSVADPDFELRRGPGSVLLTEPGFLPSVISSFFTQNREGGGWAPGAPPLDPPLCVYIVNINGEPKADANFVKDCIYILLFNFKVVCCWI